MSERFTPGPWKYVDRLDMRGKPCGYEIWKAAARGAGCGAFNIIAYSPDGRTPQRKADMSLIAAAPAMYAACQKALAYLEAHRPKGDIRKIFSELNEHENGVVKPLRAALELARGPDAAETRE